MRRRAKIIATIGPATKSVDQLRELVAAGMDVARLNFSHGDHQEYANVIHHIREVAKETGRSIAILQDLQGSKLRTGELAQEDPVILKDGERFILTTTPILGTADRVHVNYPALPRDVKPGDQILIDDGAMELSVTSISAPDVETEVVHGGPLGSHKGIHLPGVQLSAPPLTSKDLEDISFGLDQGVDMVALSFVRRAEDLVELHKSMIAKDAKAQGVPIIAKLETPEAIEQLDAIFEECDGVMVARGDLGVTMSPERVPSLQKRIIQCANEKLKCVITATQMLETMIDDPHPTRAEASDVANAVFDGSDALMLSGETAIGKYPTQAVQTMSRIIIDAEEHAPEWGYRPLDEVATTEDDAVATTHAARALAYDRGVAAIAVFTRSGRTARLMSKSRPQAPILAFTPEQITYQRMALFWGVIPYQVPMAHSVEEMIDRVRQACLASGIVRSGEQVVLVASLPIGAMGPPNFTLLHTIE
ncbi:MAG TPA: pyruvate kinase [Anaerolineae bacterium]|nr:pyruvate kinase [Anaerolineae bacterium]